VDCGVCYSRKTWLQVIERWFGLFGAENGGALAEFIQVREQHEEDAKPKYFETVGEVCKMPGQPCSRSSHTAR
jgi:hypothetical protein